MRKRGFAAELMDRAVMEVLESRGLFRRDELMISKLSINYLMSTHRQDTPSSHMDRRCLRDRVLISCLECVFGDVITMLRRLGRTNRISIVVAGLLIVVYLDLNLTPFLGEDPVLLDLRVVLIRLNYCTMSVETPWLYLISQIGRASCRERVF